MTTAAIISIHGTHARKIYSGEKRFEFRTRKPARHIDYLALYETHPTKSVTGFVRIGSILEGSPHDIWKLTHEGAGVSRSFFMSYYREKSRAVAYCIDESHQLDDELTLEELGVSAPPQSFQYLEEAALNKLLTKTFHSPNRLFIGGVHGVGKTSFAKWLAERLDCEAYSSSTLIRGKQGDSPHDLNDSQNDLINALKETDWFDCGGILDGHFVLKSPDGSFFQVHEAVFSQMELSSILLLTGNPNAIAERLIARDGLQVSDKREFVESITKLQFAECERARHIANEIGVPIETIERH